MAIATATADGKLQTQNPFLSAERATAALITATSPTTLSVTNTATGRVMSTLTVHPQYPCASLRAQPNDRATMTLRGLTCDALPDGGFACRSADKPAFRVGDCQAFTVRPG